MSHNFGFNIMDVAMLLGLNIRRRQADGAYTDCPFCGDKRGKLKITVGKDVFRCNYCDEKGGVLALYAKLYDISNSEALKKINEALRTGEHNEKYQVGEKKVSKSTSIVPQSELASINTINHTLTSLFNLLRLSNIHQQNLRKRGLTDEQINQQGYKSTPSPCNCLELTKLLLEQGCIVQGVPGFYINKLGNWTVKFHKRTSGIIIPVRGIDGLIRGAQIRLDIAIKDVNDDPDKIGSKYIWLSSSNKYMGVTSGSPVHFIGNPYSQTVYVTEGGLKGNVSNALMNRTFACIAGAKNTSQLELIFSWLSQHGTKLIVEAHDMDKYSNEQIMLGANKLYIMAKKYGLDYMRLTWNPNFKGIDDWQLSLKKKQKLMERTKKMTFKEKFISGICEFNTLDSEVKKWHACANNTSTLEEYLGFNEDEYNFYLKNSEEDFKNYLLSQQKIQKFRIYQLDLSGCKTIPFAFQGIHIMRKSGYTQPPASEYSLVYEGEIHYSGLLTDTQILQRIFERYSDNLPSDYSGRSVSTSDVIELYDFNKKHYYRDAADKWELVNFSTECIKTTQSHT